MEEIESLKLIVDYAVLGLLALMSLVSLTFVFERFIFMHRLDLDQYKHHKELEIDLSNNLSIIATIASNAPYVGLLGTVVGIIITFYTLGDGGVSDPKAIMQGLALALKATALGLVVAIPSQVFYNLLARKADVVLTRWEISQERRSQ
jgi:biopolymer transport protein ExbB